MSAAADKKTIAATNGDRLNSINLSDPNCTLNGAKPLPALLQELDKLPDTWALVAVGKHKVPLGQAWQKTPLTKADFLSAYETGSFRCLNSSNNGQEYHPLFAQAQAVGVLCGTPSGGLLFIDHDGSSCDALIKNLAQQELAQALPPTVTVTSGRPGRYQAIYQVPEQYWGGFATQKIATGVMGADHKPEQLELRWDGCQSVVLGQHPTTAGYHWRPGRSPQECPVAPVPDWIIALMLDPPTKASVTPDQSQPTTWYQQWTNSDWAKSCLGAIPPTTDYDTWLQVAMALNSVDETLYPEFVQWSQGAANFEADVCQKLWDSLDATKLNGIRIGSLALLAKKKGWRSPSYATNSASLPTGQSDIEAAAIAAEELAILEEEVASVIKLATTAAPTDSLLVPQLMSPLKHLAERFNVPVETITVTLLAISGSLLRVNTKLEIDAATDFFVPPIVWFGLVGESGATKSPIFRTCLKLLEQMQHQADTAYNLALEQYHEAKTEWQQQSKEERGTPPQEPVPREYYLQDTTFEAIALAASQQPEQGLIVAVDELAGVFKSFNQYRSGRGNDRQRWLSLYDGQAIKVNRKSAPRISIPHTSVSLAGTIQPDVLHRHLGDFTTVDGFWPRFLWIPLPLTKLPPPGGGSCDVSELLASTYQALASLPAQLYRLDTQGEACWRTWHCRCEDLKVTEPNAVLRALYSKAKERAARLALIAHCLNAVAIGTKPTECVSRAMLEAAIALTEWSLGQTRLIYAEAGLTLHEDSAQITQLIARFRQAGWITARMVTHWSSSRQKLKAEAARGLMRQVVALGYAIDNGETGSGYQIKIQEADTLR